jgi:short-subunit dehydrogenase
VRIEALRALRGERPSIGRTISSGPRSPNEKGKQVTAKYEGDAFSTQFGPWAVIAGGSDGIGAAYAREAAQRGLNVALIARRLEPLAAFADSLATEFGILTKTIQADLTSADAAELIGRASADLDVGLFIYNAGSNPNAGQFLDNPVEDALFLVDLSCRGPAILAHHFGRRLRDRKRGGMILMSSMACLAGSGYQATYAATKAFDTTLAEGLWIELAPFGVDVLGVLAGATRTETMLEQRPTEFATAMDPAEVARGALDHLGKGPNWVPGEANQAAVQEMWPIPRVALVNGMTEACASLFELPAQAVEGQEFHDPA